MVVSPSTQSLAGNAIDDFEREALEKAAEEKGINI